MFNNFMFAIPFVSQFKTVIFCNSICFSQFYIQVYCNITYWYTVPGREEPTICAAMLFHSSALLNYEGWTLARGGRYIHTRGLRRGGLTSACGSVHARNSRGCRKIEPINATVLPRGTLRKFHSWIILGKERKDPTP